MSGRVWGYIGLLLGGGASVAANVAHSFVPPATLPGGLPVPDGWSPEPGAVVSAVFWPVALFVTIEVFARVEWPSGRRWVALRFGGLLPVAAVAAVVSYMHLSGLLRHYLEETITVRFGPLAVDGVMLVCTAALVATAGHRKADPGAVEDAPEALASTVEDPPETDPHVAAGVQATELLAEISQYLSDEAERIEFARVERQVEADRAAAEIRSRGEALGMWARLAQAFRKSGDRPSDDEVRAWMAVQAEATGTVPGRAAVRAFWKPAPANTTIDRLRQEVAQAAREQAADSVPETTSEGVQ